MTRQSKSPLTLTFVLIYVTRPKSKGVPDTVAPEEYRRGIKYAALLEFRSVETPDIRQTLRLMSW